MKMVQNTSSNLEDKPTVDSFENMYNITSLRKSITWDAKRTRKICDFIIYTIFLVILFIYTILLNQYKIEDSYFIGSSMKENLFGSGRMFERSIANSTMHLNLDAIQSEFDVWDWFLTVFSGTIFQETQTYPDNISITDYRKKYYIGKYNRLVGTVRLLQWRVDTTNCRHVGSLWDNTCYGGYSYNRGDTSRFGTSNQYTYQNCAAQGSTPIDSLLRIRMGSQVGLMYECDSSVIDIPIDSTLEEATMKFQTLRDTRWIDQQTRMIAIDYITSNPNLNIFMYTTIMFELLPSGAIIPSLQSNSFTFEIPVPVLFYLLFSTLFLFILYFAIIFIFDLVKNLYRTVMVLIHKEWRDEAETIPIVKLLKNPFTYIELGHLILLIICGCMKIYLLFHGARSQDLNISSFPSSFISYSKVFSIERTLIGITQLISIIRYLKPLRVFQRFYRFERLLLLAIPDLFIFAVVFFYIYSAFSFSAYFLFGPHISSFRTLDLAFINLMNIYFSKLELLPRDYISMLFIVFYSTFLVVAVLYLINIVFFITKRATLPTKKKLKKYQIPPFDYPNYIIFRIRRVIEMIRTKRFVLFRWRSFQYRLTEYKRFNNVQEISHSELLKLFSFALKVDTEYILYRHSKSEFNCIRTHQNDIELQSDDDSIQKRLNQLDQAISEQNQTLLYIASLLGGDSASELPQRRGRRSSNHSQKYWETNSLQRNDSWSQRSPAYIGRKFSLKVDPDLSPKRSEATANAPFVDPNSQSSNSLSDRIAPSKLPSSLSISDIVPKISNEPLQQDTVPFDSTSNHQSIKNSSNLVGRKSSPTSRRSSGASSIPYDLDSPLKKHGTPSNSFQNLSFTSHSNFSSNNRTPSQQKQVSTFHSSHSTSNPTNSHATLSKPYPEEHLQIVSNIISQPQTSIEKYKQLEDFGKKYGYQLKDTREMVQYLKSKK